jgi:hypothetical protein
VLVSLMYMGEVKLQLPSFLSSTLDEGGWLASYLGRFISRNIVPIGYGTESATKPGWIL